jgi:hypothetical protein
MGEYVKRPKMSFVAALSLIAAIYCTDSSAQEPHLPLSKVVDYLRVEGSNTTLQNEMSAKELVGKTFEGDIEVLDVDGSPQEFVHIHAEVTAHKQLKFYVRDPQLKDVAAKLSRGSKLEISGTLSGFSFTPSRYMNESGLTEARFTDASFRLISKNAH